MKKEILTVRKLKELIASGDESKIKMTTKVWCDRQHYTDETIMDLRDPIKIEPQVTTKGETYMLISWSTMEGDPEIEVSNDDELINEQPDTSDGNYEYTLFIEN